VTIDRRFPAQVAITLVSIAALAAYPLLRYGSAEVIAAVVVGALLSTVHVLLGFFTIEYAFDKSYTVFLKAVLGGMGLRLLGLVGVLLALILVAGMHAVALTVSVMVLYLIYLILEILFLQRKVLAKGQQ
jgi:hypothetical protein